MNSENKTKYFFCRKCNSYKTIRKCDMIKHLNKKTTCNMILCFNDKNIEEFNKESLEQVYLNEKMKLKKLNQKNLFVIIV